MQQHQCAANKACKTLKKEKDENENHRETISLHEVSIYEKALSAEAITKRFKARKNEFPLPPEPLTFSSYPQLRWKNRDTLQIEWELHDPLPVEIEWKRTGETETRNLKAKTGRKGLAIIDQIQSKGEHLYRLTARNQSGATFTSEWYKFDTSLYLSLIHI